jgi:tRNA(fMet)-specific endonuclease VapC
LVSAEKSQRPAENRREVNRFAARLGVLPFDQAAAAHAAEIRATLERSGQSIGGYDTLIAGHSRSRGLIIVTRNLQEFTRVEGLRAEDWLAEPSPPCPQRTPTSASPDGGRGDGEAAAPTQNEVSRVRR